MALTPAEKQKRYRDRQRQAENAAPDRSHDFLRTPFFEAANLDDLDSYWDTIGIEGPWFKDDTGPKSLLGQLESDALARGDEAFPGRSNDSLGRAESMVSVLLDIVSELTHMINGYKLDEINARIAEIEQADLSDPATKAKALEDIVTLKAIKAQLDGKTFRRSFAEFSVKGNVST